MSARVGVTIVDAISTNPQPGSVPAGSFISRLASRPAGAFLALLALTLAVYLPGVLRLPAVDRTEIVFADTTRQMVAKGQWLDPRYGETVHRFRPIGTFWAQGAAASAAGPSHARDIVVYRLPSLVAVSLAVLALYLLAAPRLGRATAFVAAGLFAVAPLTVLVSQLAIADGLALLPATVAMLALLRLYDPEPDAPERSLALVFWAAMGLGMLVNALHTPILVAATLIALFAMDRDLGWLRRTRPLAGVPIALALAAPWLWVRMLQDGGMPFQGMSWPEFLGALGGAQDDKLRALPGTFLAAALLGFLPGVVLLPPALKRLWDDRSAPLARFLLAWIIGYIVYLELVSSKPGTYMVQVMFPAFALAVALLVTGTRPAAVVPRWSLVPWPPLAALFAVALLGAIYVFTGEQPSPLAVILIAGVAILFAWSARLGRRGNFVGWAITSVASLALFAVTLLGVVLPGVRIIWPARQAQTLVSAACHGGHVDILGFREPSAVFVLRQPRTAHTFESLPITRNSLFLVESRWLERYRTEMAARGIAPGELGCVDAFNVMRGCPLTFSLYVVDPERRGCTPASEYACERVKAQVRPPSSRACD